MRILFLSCVLQLFFSSGLAADEWEPPQNPFLRLETGMHRAIVNKVELSNDGRLAATASDDKTIRLWSLPSGRLVDVLRVPIADETEGMIYSLALSPSGKRLLASGATGHTWDRAGSIYLFDVEQRRLVARLSGIRGFIFDLDYSDDGGLFAGGLDGNGGLRVWNGRSGKLVMNDRSFGGSIYDVEFGPQGDLAAASAEGSVRLYRADMTAGPTFYASGGDIPSKISFHPNGKSLAVAYANVARIDILRTADMSILSTLGEKRPDGVLHTVAWSASGALYAAGTLGGSTGKNVIRSWKGANLEHQTDTVAAANSITALARHPESGVLFSSAEPSWGWLSGENQIKVLNKSQIADFRGIFDRRLAVSPDGIRIEFKGQRSQDRTLRFDFSTGSYSTAEQTDTSLTSSPFSTELFEIGEWRNSRSPAIAGRRVLLEKNELSRSVAVASDGLVLLGTERRLLLLDKRGMQLDEAVTSTPVWGVTIAEEAEFAVAALGDGTLRWYEIIQGKNLKERVALYPHPDGQQWVAWTPEGFFQHSTVGGKNLVGFHFNSDRKSEPHWISFSQVYRVLYAPELVKAALERRREPIEARLLDLGDLRERLLQNPEVRLVAYCEPRDEQPATRGFQRVVGVADDRTDEVSPECSGLTRSAHTRGFSRAVEATANRSDGDEIRLDDNTPVAHAADLPGGTETVRLQFAVVDHGRGIGAVDIFANGRNIGRRTSETASNVATLLERDIRLQPGMNRIQVRVYDKDLRQYGDSDVVEFSVAERTAKRSGEGRQEATVDAKPNLHILSIGVDEYRQPQWRLSLAVADARTFADTIRNRPADDYGKVEVTELYNKDVTPESIKAAFQSVAENARPQDTVLFYMAGHGIIEDDSDEFYYITENVTEFDKISEQAFGERQLITLMGDIEARNALLLLDTCYSGAASFDTAASAKFNHDMGRYIIAASSTQEEALDSFDGKNGVFAYAVKEGLEGLAVNARVSEAVDSMQLGAFVQLRVPQLAAKRGHRQSAEFRTASDRVTSFPITRVEKDQE